jgi:uncharacterized protein
MAGLGSTAGRLLAAAVLGGGVALGGWFAGQGLRAPRADDRYVTVKGLAEREVRADLALWPLRFVVTGNDLAEVRGRVAEAERAVRRFLAEGGIPAEAVGVAGLEVTDALAQVYRSGPVESRFVIAQTLLVRTPEVDRVAALAQRAGDLVAAGVVLSSEGGPASGPVYAFTRLNDHKPAMIAEATRNARAGAEQFAKDSGAALGGIRQASQGVFQILPRDEAPGVAEPGQPNKRLRVVATVDYHLRD